MSFVVVAGQHLDTDYPLDQESLDALWRMEEGHFWHRARNRWIGKALREAGVLPPATILEVGCGSGIVLTYLQREGYALTGVDTAEVQVRKAHERSPESRLILGDVANLPPQYGGPYDALGFFDVLEHLDDPGSLIESALGHARRGTVVVATVPARQALFSAVDTLAGHKRRYERGQLTRLFEAFSVRRVVERGMFVLCSPLLARQRSGLSELLEDPASRLALFKAVHRVPSKLVNGLLDVACTIEQTLGAPLTERFTGTSLLATGVYDP